MPFPRIGIPPPKPTANYIKISGEDPQRLQSPSSSHLLVLDLNGTLLFRDKSDYQKGSVTPHMRPSLKAFINYILKNFKVMVWSSATPINVQAMIQTCFSDKQVDELVGIWSRDTLGLTPMEYKRQVRTYKQLSRIWSNGAFQGPVGPWSQKTTILLDDTFVKAQAQPYNLVEVPEYDYEKVRQGNDVVLREVAAYLEELRYQGNVSAYIRKNKFTPGQGWKDDVLSSYDDLSPP